MLARRSKDEWQMGIIIEGGQVEESSRLRWVHCIDITYYQKAFLGLPV